MNHDAALYELRTAREELDALISSVEEFSASDFSTMLVIRQIRTRLDYVHNGLALSERARGGERT